VADKLGVNLEQQEVDNDKDQKSIEKQHHAMDQLRTLEGAEFDAAFLKAMADGHKDVINRLESVQNEVSGDLKTLISDLLPNLRKHAQIAKELQSR
jgi:putative membrane protein